MTPFSLHPQLDADTHFVADLPLCTVRLMNDARYPWLVLIPRRDAIREAGATAKTSEDRIKRHTGELTGRLKTRVRERLYALLDDRK